MEQLCNFMLLTETDFLILVHEITLFRRGDDGDDDDVVCIHAVYGAHAAFVPAQFVH